jgi:anti-sigma regulatory factor (Ser/Thr protein kinase)
VGQPEVFAHEALYYTDLDEFLDGCTSFVREGLKQDEPVLVAVPEPRLSALRDAHRDEPVDFVDMGVAGRNPNRILPWVLRAFIREHAPTPVRIIGEPIFVGRSPEEIDVAVQHEALINVAFTGVEASILCPYDVRNLSDLADADRTHPTIVDTTGRRASPAYTSPYRVFFERNRPLSERMMVDEALVFDANRLAHVRSVVTQHAVDSGVNKDRLSDLSLAVSEVCSNAITHGGPGLATIRMWADDDRVVYEIRGAGHIRDVMAGRTVPPKSAARGRGLLIANQLCDLVQTYTAPAGTVTRLHMLLSDT